MRNQDPAEALVRLHAAAEREVRRQTPDRHRRDAQPGPGRGAPFDLLLEENLGISTVGLGTNPHTLHAFVSHPAGMIASDAILFGEYPNPRTYGCFPIVLAEFVRAEKHLRLPEAIRKMTSFPAQRLGLPDRGILRDGFRADIVVFDPDTVKTHARHGDPKHYPVGIDYVIVNGQVVIDDGENTGALPGRGLRRGRGTT